MKEAICEALKSRLENNLSDPIAFPNVHFAGAESYYLVQWATSTREGGLLVGGARKYETGLMDVQVIGPIGIGEGPANAMAEAIDDLFPENLTIDAPGIKIRITEPCDVRGGYRDDHLWRVPVIVKYEARAV